MNRDLIENHLKNLESLENHKVSSEIKFKKLKKIDEKEEDLTLYEKIKYIPNLVYYSATCSYLFLLSMVIYLIIYEKKKSFSDIFKDIESKKIFN